MDLTTCIVIGCFIVLLFNTNLTILLLKKLAQKMNAQPCDHGSGDAQERLDQNDQDFSPRDQRRL